MKKIFAYFTATVIALSGCAEKSSNVQSTYVSPVQYERFSCRQISEEASRISARAAQVAGVQDKNAQGDAVATGVALVLFWPAAFFIRGNKENRAELARLKGEMEALEQASIRKNCNIDFVKS
ncbi:hypothetical protein [Celeribacter halophilus]|jgi:hypothetical protein|uniref:hypothetical protein n=1 Tax=Celeribacter halophilus TaxID=576117 RepID=UPI003A94BC7B